MRFDTEADGVVQIRRILEYLYENLKISNVYDAQSKIKRHEEVNNKLNKNNKRRESKFLTSMNNDATSVQKIIS